ncbi:MAG: 3-dehydroquinate synthase [Rickettsiales bacterium]|nr:3-dehydroquinate synthase [Rickettsiales bacterium]OUV83164.1 MAG: 3-dehydroquinate synthase [Rickettsiales bacterium TMED131]
MIKINVNLKYNSYKVFIKSNLFEEVVYFHNKKYSGCKAIIITDSNVKKYYLKKLVNNFKKYKVNIKTFSVPAGEQSKSFKTLESLSNKILSNGINRNDIIYALGGGIVGDLTGFLSSILLRGIKFIQIPTTLLSQVDSSVGGKTAINAKIGKNLIGSFFQPSAVFVDPNTLNTLSKKELLAGYAEVVKYSIINDRKFFNWLEKNHKNIYNLEPDSVVRILSKCIKKKAEIVKIDEKEDNTRMLLNFGHTFAHAIESEMDYKIRHGEAVSVGMLMAMRLSFILGYTTLKEYSSLESHLKKFDLPIRLKQISSRKNWVPQKLLINMQSDKKVFKGSINFILCKGIGKAFIKRDINHVIIKEIIQDLID